MSVRGGEYETEGKKMMGKKWICVVYVCGEKNEIETINVVHAKNLAGMEESEKVESERVGEEFDESKQAS